MTTVTAPDIRGLADEELLSLFRSDERTAAAVLAEAARRDRADRAASKRGQLRAEWYDAAYAQFLAAEEATRGNLLSRDGIAARIADPFSLWSGRADLAERFASPELVEFWETSPRVTVGEYMRQVATAHRTAREDITTDEGSTDEAVDADGARAVRRGGGAGAGEPVRADGRDGQGEAGPAAGSVRGGGRAVTSYLDIEPLETVWLVQDRLPRGEVVLIAGEGGTGKGMSMCDLAAAVTTGRDWAGQPVVTTGSVVMISPEDDLNETVAYRLRAVGADLGKVHDLTFAHGGAPFELSVKAGQFGSIPQLRELIDAIGDVVLVIIDPLMATVDGPIASNIAARRVMSPLQRMAKETGVCVAMTHHTVKSGAVAGSKGLVDAARLVYRLAKDPANPAIRVLSVDKTNNTAPLEDARYTIDGDGRDARIVWLGREELDNRRQAWRKGDVTAVRAMQSPASLGCDHPDTRFGTRRECGKCPAKVLHTRPPAAAPSAPRRPVTRFSAVAVAGGTTTRLGTAYGSLADAQEACEREAGTPLEWTPGSSGRAWLARTPSATFAVATAIAATA